MSKNSEINYTGLRKRPQMEQIVDYLENGQERVQYPDREAKFIRNHPFMTQLDFFDMQEEEKKAWEEEKRKQEAKEIATQTKTSEAIESTKKKSRQDTVLPRPDGTSREEMQQAWTEDFENKRYYNDTWEEHDAESKTMETMRNFKSDSNAQTVRFTLRRQTQHPDSDTFQSGLRPLPSLKVKKSSPISVREDVPTQMGTKVQGSLPIGVKADTAPKLGFFARELGEWKRMLFGGALSPRSQAEADKEYARMVEGEAFYREQQAAEKERTILAFIDEQARKEQEDFMDTVDPDDEGDKADPSSSSAAAVQPPRKVAPTRDESGAVPKLMASQSKEPEHFYIGKGAKNKGRRQVDRKARLQRSWYEDGVKT
jgi:hypothetical protein